MTLTSAIVVDDSEIERYVLMQRLSKLGCFARIEAFRSGLDFLDAYFSEKQPDTEIADPESLLVFMDINMPGLNGFETVEAMENALADGRGPRNCSVIVCSSSQDPKDRTKSESLPLVDTFFEKPLRKADLVRIAEQYGT